MISHGFAEHGPAPDHGLVRVDDAALAGARTLGELADRPRAAPRTDEPASSPMTGSFLPLLLVALAVIVFRSAYEQSGNTIMLWVSDRTQRTLGGWDIPAPWFSSLNPLLIIVLIVGAYVMMGGMKGVMYTDAFQGGIMVLGILAAIAIPAYSDYTMRAKVAQAINEATYLKVVVSEYFLTNDKCPANGDADIDSPESYASDTLEAIRVGQDESTGECVIQLVFKQLGTAEAGSEIVLTRGESGDWRATSTLPDRVLPASMRR